MAEYRLTVGLEIHAELKTSTKMFCACLNDADEPQANVNICPVCMAHPGTLPVINSEAVRKVLLVGTALGSKLADYTEFDRKNYFYPDIPKGYQISQFKYPLVSGGALLGIELTRIHLEEDTARSQHMADKSLVDYNRAGVPLMELVTEPVIHDAATAGRFAKELQMLLRALGASDANMEKGEMRVEANISVAPIVKAGATSSASDDSSDHAPQPDIAPAPRELVLGTKVEVKNLNSFRSVERAIAYEAARQSKLLTEGGVVVQETRGWDETKQVTFSQRKKESSHDYRYFPDPDLPKLILSKNPEFSLENLTKEIAGKLPSERREKYISFGLKSDDAEMFVSDELLGTLFDETLALEPASAQAIANYIASDIAGLISKLGKGGLAHITPKGLSVVIASLAKNELSSRGAKDAIAEVFTDGGDLSEVFKKYLQQSDTGALAAIAQKVIEANPGVVLEYKAGKESVMQFLVGQGMKESKGSANPAALREQFVTLLQ